jgi:hypothetical protein
VRGRFALIAGKALAPFPVSAASGSPKIHGFWFVPMPESAKLECSLTLSEDDS